MRRKKLPLPKFWCTRPSTKRSFRTAAVTTTIAKSINAIAAARVCTDDLSITDRRQRSFGYLALLLSFFGFGLGSGGGGYSSRSMGSAMTGRTGVSSEGGVGWLSRPFSTVGRFSGGGVDVLA